MFKKCDICQENVVDVYRVEKMKYCEDCLEKAKLEAADDEKFFRKFRYMNDSYQPIEVKANGKNYITLVNNSGAFVEKKDLLILAEKLIDFMGIDDIENEIKAHNHRQELGHKYQLREDENGLFIIPNDFMSADKREFDQDKRAWSFKCACCGEKTGTKTHKYYYVLKSYRQPYELGRGETACSVACANVIAKDNIKNLFSKAQLKYIKPLDDWEIEVTGVK